MPLYLVATPIGNLRDLTERAREVLAACDAVAAGVQVVPVPGASAVIAAVSVSGFAEGRFHFAGFLPRKPAARTEMLSEIKSLRAQLAFYESPQRLRETLLELRAALGDRPALV